VSCHDVWFKKAGATYQKAMNLIFHKLLGSAMKVYIDDIVVKSAEFDSHIADLHKAFDKMHRCGLKMNPHKYAFGVSAGKFLGFVIHKHGIEIDMTELSPFEIWELQLVSLKCRNFSVK
jgi:hypothetical protein